jgi:hypothetical protein
MMNVKKIMCAVSLTTLTLTLAARATTYTGTPIYSAGTGTNAATVALDFDYNQSFLFTYHWEDGTEATVWNAIHEVDLAGNGLAKDVSVVATDYGSWGMYVNSIAYPDGVAHDYGDDYSVGWVYYLSNDNDYWTNPQGGCSVDTVTNGGWVSWVWTNSDSNWTPLRGPGGMATPEPLTFLTILAGIIGIYGRRKVS